jgi:hypothetical protein
LFHVNTILGLEAQAQANSNLPPTHREHLAPPVIVDTSQSEPALMPGCQPFIWTVTIDDVMTFHILISSDTKVILMSLHIFFTLQIPVSSLTLASIVQGPSSNIMKNHKNVVLPITHGATNNFQTFLVNFFIIGPMLPYEAILTWGEH